MGVKLLSLCLNSEGKSGVVAILSLKKLRVRQISILLYSNEGILHFYYQLFLAPLQVACILPQNTINTIFSNVEAIQAVNRELLSHMETKGLGDAFLALAPFIKLYSTYANNFAKAQSELQVSNHKIKLLCSIDINNSPQKNLHSSSSRIFLAWDHFLLVLVMILLEDDLLGALPIARASKL